MNKLIAKAPAKLILAGEHAVLYGAPALAMAINCYTETTVTLGQKLGINFNFLNLNYASFFTLTTLKQLQNRLQKKYNEFLLGHITIRNVLRKPFELLQYTVSQILLSLEESIPQAIEIKVKSQIPIGCGMGSSAAAIISMLHAIARFLHLEFDLQKIFSLGVEVENLQHGKSSGLDIHLATFGGCVYFCDGQAKKSTLPEVPLYIVNTGKPLSTTGEVVMHTRPYFLRDPGLRVAFTDVVTTLDKALQTNDRETIKSCLILQEKLLEGIGVVPQKVQSFIKELHINNNAAKICGAGAIAGNNAGVVLVIPHDVEHLQALVAQYNYSLTTINSDQYGTTIL